MDKPPGVCVDANVASRFHPELERLSGPVYELVEDIAAGPGLAVDTRGVILAEWRATCGSRMFEAWVARKRWSGQLRDVDARLPQDIVRRIRREFGLPPGSPDMDYIRCANSTGTRYILSEDIDLYDPKLKKADAKAKYRAREERQGRLCRFLADELSIKVGACRHCRADLKLPKASP